MLTLGLMLLLTAVLLPEIVAEGGWRAWVGVPVSVGVLGAFLAEIYRAKSGDQPFAKRDTDRSCDG
ncbi:hypothetical protein Asi02nite_07610 [Asanoa siamensis]|uniref:Uncharacterized protein n=1 Tax=Asanoa siamensis TaxID=926357 RepID=A0ABQ4CJU2_9ACTN|nr:hypothetical protein Asi02nite_07610 [Asanoa siamensis]